MRTTISRDPFARVDIIRETVPKDERHTCAWCGSQPGRFRYGNDPDRGTPRPYLEPRAFCSKSCRDCYAGD